MGTDTDAGTDAGRAPERTVGERGFRMLAIGQITSLLGTNVSGIAVSIVAYLETGSVWWLSVLYLASRLPALLVGAHAGSLADRLDRRRILLVADSVAGVAVGLAATLHVLGALELWHLIVLAVVGSAANAYQDPAFQAAVPTLVPVDRLDRANGLLQLGPAVATLAGPAIAGVVVAFAGIGGVLLLDLITFAVAVTMTTLVRFPSPTDDPAPRTSTWATLRSSWAYLQGPRRGMRRMILAGTLANLALSMVNVLLLAILIPLVGEGGTGALLSLGGVAMLAASAAVSAKGLPARRIPLMGATFSIVGIGLVFMGARAHVVPVAIGIMVTLAAVSVFSAAAATTYQAVIEPAWQGRLAALRRLAAEALVPVGVLVVAPLVESLAEPAMAVDGPLAGSVGLVLGVGDGRGVGLVTVAVGLVVTVIGWWVGRDPQINELDGLAAEREAAAVAARAAQASSLPDATEDAVGPGAGRGTAADAAPSPSRAPAVAPRRRPGPLRPSSGEVAAVGAASD